MLSATSAAANGDAENNGTVSLNIISFVKFTLKLFQKQEWTINDFEVGRLLGKGRFGSVYLAKEKSGFVVALKVLFKKDIKEHGSPIQLKREVELQYHLRFVFIYIRHIKSYNYFLDIKIFYDYMDIFMMNNEYI